MSKKTSSNYNLQLLNPTLASEWHPTKNGTLTPADVMPYSNKKVFWLCKERGHSWPATVYHRSAGRGCPGCSGRLATPGNCLQTLNPALASEWHPTKNGTLTPADVMPYSNKKVQWRCKKNPVHEWPAAVYSRSAGRGCPYCARQAAWPGNRLQTLNPALAQEWHPTLNGVLTPKNVTPWSHKKIQWCCKKNPVHEWPAAVYHRNRGSGCPCCHPTTSELELRVYSEMKHLFRDVLSREKIHGAECDVYIPRFKIGIEIDGAYWHKDNHSKDAAKNRLFEKKGILLLRLRGKGLPKISDDDILFSKKDERKNNSFGLIKKLIDIILGKIVFSQGVRRHIGEYLKGNKIANEDEYLKPLKLLPSPLPGYSLADKNPALASEWHPTKNGTLTPADVTPHSGKKSWWRCKKPDKHEWPATVYSRTNGSGCPGCYRELRLLDHKKTAQAIATHKDNFLPIKNICKTLGISKTTFYRYVSTKNRVKTEYPVLINGKPLNMQFDLKLGEP